MSTKAEREFIQAPEAGPRPRWGGREVKRAPTSESRLPLAPGVFGNPAREPWPRAASPQVFRGRASPPRSLPGHPQAQSRGGQAGSRPLAASPSHSAQAAPLKPRSSHGELRSPLSPGWAHAVNDPRC